MGLTATAVAYRGKGSPIRRECSTCRGHSDENGAHVDSLLYHSFSLPTIPASTFTATDGAGRTAMLFVILLFVVVYV